MQQLRLLRRQRFKQARRKAPPTTPLLPTPTIPLQPTQHETSTTPRQRRERQMQQLRLLRRQRFTRARRPMSPSPTPNNVSRTRPHNTPTTPLAPAQAQQVNKTLWAEPAYIPSCYLSCTTHSSTALSPSTDALNSPSWSLPVPILPMPDSDTSSSLCDTIDLSTTPTPATPSRM